MRMHTLLIAGSMIAALSTQTVRAQCGSSSDKATMRTASYAQSDIVATAAGNDQFSTLVAAVKAAGLVEALQGDGPFTVFAPTNDAFAKLPDGTVEELLKPQNREQLVAILTYHVIPGRLMAGDVVKAGGATTLQGQQLDFNVKGSTVKVDQANVVKTDIDCRNGVIHVIDTVVLPAQQNIVATAKSTKMFDTLLTAATRAGLADTLSNGGPFTVFAPTDEAFSKLPSGTLESLLQPENREQLATILKYHVVSGRVYAADAIKAGNAKTLAGEKVQIRAKNGKVRVNDAAVLTANVDASNGVIHVIDTVILPS